MDAVFLRVRILPVKLVHLQPRRVPGQIRQPVPPAHEHELARQMERNHLAYPRGPQLGTLHLPRPVIKEEGVRGERDGELEEVPLACGEATGLAVGWSERQAAGYCVGRSECRAVLQ